MAKTLSQNLVPPPLVALGSDRLPELRLYRGEHRLGVGPLVVVGQVVFAVEHEQVVHPRPHRIVLRENGVLLERDVGRAAEAVNGVHVPARQVSLVRRYLRNVEVLGRPLHQREEEVRVVDGGAAYVHGGNDVGLHAAHQVRLEPLPALGLLAVLVVVPADEPRRAEARRVYGKVRFDRLQGQAAHRHELPQDRRENRVGKVAAHAVEVRSPTVSRRSATSWSCDHSLRFSNSSRSPSWNQFGASSPYRSLIAGLYRARTGRTVSSSRRRTYPSVGLPVKPPW